MIIPGATWHNDWFGELGNRLSSPEYSILVSAPDLPGHGLSGDPVLGYRYRERNSHHEIPLFKQHEANNVDD